MKSYRNPLLACAALILGGLLYYFYGGGTPPAGQHELIRLDPANFAQLRQEFNAAGDRVRLIALLSPT
jgi:hypothetical protein